MKVKIMNHKLTYKNFFKILVNSILLLIIFFDQNGFSKPIPPGSGVGDIPANILFLLDNSKSMRRQIISGDSMYNARDVVELDSGDLIYAQDKNLGLVKFNYTTELKDGTFAENKTHFRGTANDPNCSNKNSIIGTVNSLGITNIADSNTTNDIIWGSAYSQKKIIAVTTEGKCHDVIELIFHPSALTVRKFGSDEHLIAVGKAGSAAYVFSYNITQGVSRTQSFGSGSFRSWMFYVMGIAMDGADGTPDYLYHTYKNGNIARTSLSSDGTTFMPSNSINKWWKKHNKTKTNKHLPAHAIELDPESDTIMFTTSRHKGALQKITIGSTLSPIKTWRKKHRRASTSSSVTFWQPRGLFIGSTEDAANNGNGDFVYTSGNKPSGQAFLASNAMTWQNEVGGGGGTRLQGAKAAIKAIVTDTSLTSGANYGYAHWSAGTPTNGHTPHRCHRQQRNCDYYDGWIGTHPDGTSKPCTKGACIRVGIHKEGYSKIPAALSSTVLIFGTDSRAFAQFASEYFRENNLDNHPYDPNSSCQLNYAIVIGDGAWTGHNIAARKIKALRKDLGVKTLVVAYGGGISTNGMSNFSKMAIEGSCDDSSGTHEDCEPVIIADTPQQLKTQLKSKITQIIADRLSFTAPSITATIEEGGALYQAQFNYEQHEEWKGTILRKAIDKDGIVIHEPTHSGNWDAAEQVRAQTSRKIWTVIPDIPYTENNWNNWSEDNAEEIQDLLELTDNEMVDYHRLTTDSASQSIGKRCSASSGVEDGIDDDVIGLINFVRGQDYFDYDGDCNLTEKRDHILGDLYHSQIITVANPRADTHFSGTNQESYWRAINKYNTFATDFANREDIIYAGGNDGMLHALNSTTGEEEWAFIPPFIASSMPTIGNLNLNREAVKGGGGSNAIFGVDGSPVVHDMYFRGIDKSGNFESARRWHTIMIIPYGRGGAGYSILDVTRPIEPLHLFSVFNDTVNRKVFWSDHEGNIDSEEYIGNYYTLLDSEEAKKANENESEADDELNGKTVATNWNCETIANFASAGEKSCYTGVKWSFNLPVRGESINKVDLRIVETSDSGAQQEISGYNLSNASGSLIITFGQAKSFTASQYDNENDDLPDDYPKSANISIEVVSTSLTGLIDNPQYNYSQLGETWSTPRVFRLPNKGAGDENIMDDKYVMVMGGGMGSHANKAGSNIFIINLEDEDGLGRYGKVEKIVQIEDTVISNILNSTPASPVVITPDLTVGIPWRGALVYQPDLEGKITKLNLTNMKTDGLNNTVKMYDNCVLFNVKSNTLNGRYMYHSLDAAIGGDTRKFWLYGGTGDYERISDRSDDIDNVLFGIKDNSYPYYRVETTSTVSTTFSLGVGLLSPNPGMINPSTSFVGMTTPSAALTPNVKAQCADALTAPDLLMCSDTTDDTTGAECPTITEIGWVIHMPHSQKTTAEPTIYRGNVYYPVYRPDPGQDRCNLGAAFICSADDECGTNISSELGTNTEFVDDKCYYVNRGILSELVVFGDRLFANLAGPSETEKTLVSVKTAAGEVDSYRRSWRLSY